MKLIKTASGTKLRISKSEWEAIGLLFCEAGGSIPMVTMKTWREFLSRNGYHGPVRINGSHQTWKNDSPPAGWTNVHDRPSVSVGFAATSNEKMMHPAQIAKFVKYFMRGFELNQVLRDLGVRSSVGK